VVPHWGARHWTWLGENLSTGVEVTGTRQGLEVGHALILLHLTQTRNLDLGALNRANSKIPLGLVLSEVVNMPSSSAELRNM